jgi:hypothetical protein
MSIEPRAGLKACGSGMPTLIGGCNHHRSLELGSGRSKWTIRIHITTRLSFPMEHLCGSMRSVKVSMRRCCNCLLPCARQRKRRSKGAFLSSASRIACDRSPRHGWAWPWGLSRPSKSGSAQRRKTWMRCSRLSQGRDKESRAFEGGLVEAPGRVPQGVGDPPG